MRKKNLMQRANSHEPTETGDIQSGHESQLSEHVTFDRTRSITVQIYEHLLEDIVSLKLKPGEHISVKDLAPLFGTSRSPVREAILRLANEGLIEIFPQSGTRISPIRMSVVREVYFVRRAIEVALVQELAAKRTPDQISALREILRQQNGCVAREDIPAFYRLDERFHQAIAEFAGFPQVWQSMFNQKSQMDRLRHLVLPLPSRPEQIANEHEVIVDSIARGDLNAAEAAMGYHLQQVFVIQEVLRETYPDYFE